MSRASVRGTVAAWFGGVLVAGTTGKYQGGPVPKLGTLYLAPPKRFPATDFMAGQAAGAQSGAMVVVRIGEQKQSRLTSGVAAGIKRHAYGIRLDVYHLSMAKDAVDAQTDFDVFCDALEARLAADPTLGGAVFLAGEGDAGDAGIASSPSAITWEFGHPTNTGERTETFGCLTFTVVEHTTP